MYEPLPNSRKIPKDENPTKTIGYHPKIYLDIRRRTLLKPPEVSIGRLHPVGAVNVNA